MDCDPRARIVSAGEDPESGLLRVWYFATLECIDFGCAGGACPFGRCSGRPPANCSAEPEHSTWGSTNISGAMLYAESRDGVSFNKPELGLVSVKGSNKNNVVLDLGAKGDGFSVLRDDRDTADRRWKLISGSCAVAGCEGARVAVSQTRAALDRLDEPQRQRRRRVGHLPERCV